MSENLPFLQMVGIFAQVAVLPLAGLLVAVLRNHFNKDDGRSAELHRRIDVLTQDYNNLRVEVAGTYVTGALLKEFRSEVMGRLDKLSDELHALATALAGRRSTDPKGGD
jgi:hypothetical protein